MCVCVCVCVKRKTTKKSGIRLVKRKTTKKSDIRLVKSDLFIVSIYIKSTNKKTVLQPKQYPTVNLLIIQSKVHLVKR